jgi:hypothetical protein
LPRSRCAENALEMSLPMNTLLQIEKKYGFTLPVAYRSFVDRGYMRLPGKDYLWVHEAEWLPPSEMLDKGGFWGNPKPGLVAFAFTGGRGLWAWQTKQSSKEGEPMIAFCPCDSYEGWWHAPTFLGWLYRVSLEYACSMWDEESETKTNLHRWAAVLREFHKLEWSDVVQSVAARPVVLTKFGENSLISLPEVHDRIAAAFGPSFINSPYIWDLEGEPATG